PGYTAGRRHQQALWQGHDRASFRRAPQPIDRDGRPDCLSAGSRTSDRCRPKVPRAGRSRPMSVAHDVLVGYAKSFGLLYLMALSAAVLAYTFWPANKKRFDQAAQSIFRDEDKPWR